MDGWMDFGGYSEGVLFPHDPCGIQRSGWRFLLFSSILWECSILAKRKGFASDQFFKSTHLEPHQPSLYPPVHQSSFRVAQAKK
jgi:hypothetical protein